MKCGNCDSEFDPETESVKVRGTNRYSNKDVVIAHECPSCGDNLSIRFTREWNTRKCGCSATVDSTYGREICSECGNILGRGGVKKEWAIPASEDMRIKSSDAEDYWKISN